MLTKNKALIAIKDHAREISIYGVKRVGIFGYFVAKLTLLLKRR